MYIYGDELPLVFAAQLNNVIPPDVIPQTEILYRNLYAYFTEMSGGKQIPIGFLTALRLYNSLFDLVETKSNNNQKLVSLFENVKFRNSHIHKLLSLQVKELNLNRKKYEIPSNVTIENWALYKGLEYSVYLSSEHSSKGINVVKALDYLRIKNLIEYLDTYQYYEILPVYEEEVPGESEKCIRFLYCWWPMIAEFEKEFSREIAKIKSQKIKCIYSPIPQAEFFLLLHTLSISISIGEKNGNGKKYSECSLDKYLLQLLTDDFDHIDDGKKVDIIRNLIGNTDKGHPKSYRRLIGMKEKSIKEFQSNGASQSIKNYLHEFENFSSDCLKYKCKKGCCTLGREKQIKDWLYIITTAYPCMFSLFKPITELYLRCKKMNPYFNLIGITDAEWFDKMEKYRDSVKSLIEEMNVSDSDTKMSFEKDINALHKSLSKKRPLNVAIIGDCSSYFLKLFDKVGVKVNILDIKNNKPEPNERNKRIKILQKQVCNIKECTKNEAYSSDLDALYFSAALIIDNGKNKLILTEQGIENMIKYIDESKVRCLAPKYKRVLVTNYVTLDKLKDYYKGEFDCIESDSIVLIS